MNQPHPDHYQDILHTNWPQPSLRGRMPLETRAKIFMPFSALKGLSQAIQQQIQEVELEQQTQRPKKGKEITCKSP